MTLPPLLVASDVVLLLDLERGTYRPLLPDAAALQATRDHLYVVRCGNEQSRIDKHDRQGQVWSRRLERCYDVHSLALLGNNGTKGVAVTSTGSNEVIFLDAAGTEIRRWSPDPAAEADSWHLNSVVNTGRGLHVSCFGRFTRFRGWNGQVADSGLVLDLEANQAVLTGLSAPHDPCRLDDGWLVNDSDRSRTLFIPDRGPQEIVAQAPGFSRGLVVLPEHFVIGYSSPRDRARQDGNAVVLVVERRTNRLLKTIALPYTEIGQMCLAPAADVLEGVDREQHHVREYFGLHPTRDVIGPEDRVGDLEVLQAPCKTSLDPWHWEVLVRLTNRGRKAWSTCNLPPVHLAYQAVDRAGRLLLMDGERTQLPVPVYPGTHLTLPMQLGAPPAALPPQTLLRLTVVQETVAWWEASPNWQPAQIALPGQ